VPAWVRACACVCVCEVPVTEWNYKVINIELITNYSCIGNEWMRGCEGRHNLPCSLSRGNGLWCKSA
jgi:hypothetical protein